MTKRLRKKYRTGEYQEFSFSFSFNYKGDVDSKECEAFLRSLIEDCIEANGLDCDGHLTGEGCFMTLSDTKPAATKEAQRQAVKAWFDSRSDAEVISFTELEDKWYGGL